MTSLLTHWKLIIGFVLIGLLIVLWLLWRGQVAEVGRLESINTELSGQVRQAEEDKANLQATLESNSRISEQDILKQQQIQKQVVQLNKTIDQLKSEKKLLKPRKTQDCSVINGDEELSDELKVLLKNAYQAE